MAGDADVWVRLTMVGSELSPLPPLGVTNAARVLVTFAVRGTESENAPVASAVPVTTLETVVFTSTTMSMRRLASAVPGTVIVVWLVKAGSGSSSGGAGA